MKLLHHNYGKARVRVLKVTRAGTVHSIKELDVSIMLRGNFDASYTKGDNTLVVPTDTMKNTVNVLAKERLGEEIEEFGIILGQHFLGAWPQVERVEARLVERCWQRAEIDGKPHPHSFIGEGGGKPFAEVESSRLETRVRSGIEDLLILKTTQSGFEGFAKDKFTTLRETKDRIFATQLKAAWLYKSKPASYSKANTAIREAMLRVFAETYSPSVQTTLFQMGAAALGAAAEISEINIVMPNKHCLLIDLAPYGLENQNELFLPTDEPHGVVEGTIARD